MKWSNQIAENKIKKLVLLEIILLFLQIKTVIANFNLLSLIQIVKMHNLNVEKYLNFIFEDIDSKVECLSELLP